MFQFPGLALAQYHFMVLGFPIRKSADQFVFANPRSLSQLITSFFASESQGILRTPLITFFCYAYALSISSTDKICILSCLSQYVKEQ
jgi:hypothetical protein